MREKPSPSRRSLLGMIGVVAGSAAMFHAMTELGYAEGSPFQHPVKLSPPPPGTSVLVLGAGVAGMVAAMELRDAGYQVRLLEYYARHGGRNWTLRGGDTYIEMGGATQQVRFDPGHYLNPGPWRLPYHHRGVLHYARRLGVALEPFTQVNYNAYLHSTLHHGGKPRRYRQVQADFQGHVAELLAKSTRQNALDDAVTRQDREILLEALREWGALNQNYEYTAGFASSMRRGFAKDPGGGLNSAPVPSTPAALGDMLESRLWSAISAAQDYDLQSSIFQPKGGMGMIGAAMGKNLGPLIAYNCKVTDIRQDGSGVTVRYVDRRAGKEPRSARAQWCICTIPTPILSQIPMNVGPAMHSAIDQLSYLAAFKVGLQFKRRFWEEDEQIYGGITYTDLPIQTISYPMWDYFSKGKGVLLGAYTFGHPAYFESSKTPQERVRDAVEQGARIHPQYKTEFETGVAVAWHRVPFTMGCQGAWTDESRAEHYNNLCEFDGRIVIASEHASRLPGWQEGSVLSALDALGRLQERVMKA
jgi:monoamine oxidase